MSLDDKLRINVLNITNTHPRGAHCRVAPFDADYKHAPSRRSLIPYWYHNNEKKNMNFTALQLNLTRLRLEGLSRTYERPSGLTSAPLVQHVERRETASRI